MADDTMKEVDRLLKDRERYESWLARLESEKPETSTSAYEKVRRDYKMRLDEVLGQLKAHSDSIRGKLSDLGEQINALGDERASRSEALDEARLRRSVGEFADDNEWKKREGDLMGALRQTEDKLAGVRKEIDRLEEIVSLVEGTEAAPPRPEPEPEPEPEPVAAAPQPEPEPEPEPVAAGGPDEGDEDEGLISLEELVLEDEDMEGIEIKTEPVGAEAEATGEGESGEAGVGDELAFLESLSLGGGEASGEAESFSFLEQQGSGTRQTIICPHCSAANDPAEWYCTECGEELPAE